MTAFFAISTLLFLVLVIAFPIWDLIEVKRLRAAQSIKARGFYYWRIVAVEWSVALLAIALLGLRATLFYNMPVRPAWLLPQSILVGMLVGLIAGVSIPIMLAARRPAGGGFLAKQLAAIDYLLPKTQSQRWLFLLVSLTAGVCEEVIFRAFAIHYLAALLPNVSIWICVALAALLFGLIHMGQGIGGVLSTGVLGAIFGVLYIGFGGLWVPIVLHIVIDARFALLPVPETP